MGTGQQWQLSDLYELHSGALWRHVVRLTGNTAAADDIVQETLLRAWKKRRTLDPEASRLRPWLFRVAHNLVVDDVRSARHRHESVTETLPDRPSADRSNALFDAMVIEAAMAELSTDHRTAVVLAYYGGRTVAEIARELDIAEGTVKSRLHYGLRALRLALQEKGGDPVTGQDSHDARFEQWDGAYVLGALGPDDRRAYEEHLRSCERCRAEVAELGGMPGLLSRVPTTRALGLIGESADGVHGANGADGADLTPPADLAERLQRRARQRRRRPLLVAAGAGIAAAILVVAGVLGVRTFTTPTPTVTADLQPTSAVGNPGELTAQVQLFAKGWGTEIDTRCDHKVSAGGGSYAGTGYGLFVVDASGRSTLVSSWQGVRQSPISTTAATATKINDMRRLELRNLVDNTLLLSAPVRG